MPKRSGRRGQSAGESDGAALGAVNDDVYPDDSLTLVFEATAEQDDANEPLDDEHTDDESDECFYARLSTWVTSIQPGPPPSQTTNSARSLPGSKTPSPTAIVTDLQRLWIDKAAGNSRLSYERKIIYCLQFLLQPLVPFNLYLFLRYL